jgi:hypothetical protein
LLSPFLKNGRQLLVEWNDIAGILRLDVTNSTMNAAALDGQEHLSFRYQNHSISMPRSDAHGKKSKQTICAKLNKGD